MCAFLPRRHLSGQLEVELSGFAGLRLGVEDRCFDLSIDKKSDFISANCEAIENVMAVAIGLKTLEKFFASIRISAPLTGRSLGSFTSPSTEVPAQTVTATNNEPTKLRTSDFGSIIGNFRGFSLTTQRRICGRPGVACSRLH